MTKHRFRTEFAILIHLRQLRRAPGTKFGPTPRGTFCPRLLRRLEAA